MTLISASTVPTVVHGTGTRLLTPQFHRVRPPPQWCTSPVVFQSHHVPFPWEHDGNGTHRGGGRPSLQGNGPQWDTMGLRRTHSDRPDTYRPSFHQGPRTLCRASFTPVPQPLKWQNTEVPVDTTYNKHTAIKHN